MRVLDTSAMTLKQAQDLGRQGFFRTANELRQTKDRRYKRYCGWLHDNFVIVNSQAKLESF